MRCIVVAGGVLSCLDNGVVTASTGRILKVDGYPVIPTRKGVHVEMNAGEEVDNG